MQPLASATSIVRLRSGLEANGFSEMQVVVYVNICDHRTFESDRSADLVLASAGLRVSLQSHELSLLAVSTSED